MAIDVALLRDSFSVILEREPEITARFYEIFFERYPVVRPMFSRHDPRRQQQMLAEALVAVVDHVDDPAWLERTLPPLGAKHVDYGVRDEMYGWVAECLLAALANAAGEAWTEAVAECWTAALNAVAGLMLKGAAAVRGAA